MRLHGSAVLAANAPPDRLTNFGSSSVSCTQASEQQCRKQLEVRSTAAKSLRVQQEIGAFFRMCRQSLHISA